jgi:NAD(P)H-dependent FMN reductase
MTVRLLAFAGSTRLQSWNKKLLGVAVEAARRSGAEVRLVDLRDLPLPFYDGDLESAHGLPDNARMLKQLMVEHDGFLLSCPEYNSSITAVLKNAIDWVSRPQPNERPAPAFRGKVAGLLAASPGNLGGVRGLFTVRQVLTTLGTLVVPTQFALPRAAEAFDEAGRLKDAAQQKAVESVVGELCTITARLKPS